MKLLFGDFGNVDFDEPIPMTKEQQEAFIAFLESIFGVVELDYTDDKRSDRIGDRFFKRPWTDQEKQVLLSEGNTDEICKRLGRTWMSVVTQSNKRIMPYYMYLHSLGIDPSQSTPELVAQYLRELAAGREKARQERSKSNSISRHIEKIINAAETPCVVMSLTEFGGECANGFHNGCFTCPRNLGRIKTQEDIDAFNHIYQEEFLE